MATTRSEEGRVEVNGIGALRGRRSQGRRRQLNNDQELEEGDGSDTLRGWGQGGGMLRGWG
jgi:hypothetical protein